MSFNCANCNCTYKLPNKLVTLVRRVNYFFIKEHSNGTRELKKTVQGSEPAKEELLCDRCVNKIVTRTEDKVKEVYIVSKG